MLDSTKENFESVLRAGDEAKRLKCAHTNTEHLLLGLILQGSGSAAQTLGSFGINYKNVSVEVEKLVGTEAGYPVNIPFSRRTVAIFERSTAVAQDLQDAHVGTKHTLIALIDDALEDKNESRVAQVLENLGIDLVVLRIEALKALDSENLPSGGCFIIDQA